MPGYEPHLIMVLCIHASLTLNRISNGYSRFRRANRCAQQIDIQTQTTERATCAAIGRIYAMRAMRPRNIVPTRIHICSVSSEISKQHLAVTLYPFSSILTNSEHCRTNCCTVALSSNKMQYCAVPEESAHFHNTATAKSTSGRRYCSPTQSLVKPSGETVTTDKTRNSATAEGPRDAMY